MDRGAWQATVHGVTPSQTRQHSTAGYMFTVFVQLSQLSGISTPQNMFPSIVILYGPMSAKQPSPPSKRQANLPV